MGIVKADISVTLDGYGAGDHQSLERPFGDLDVRPVHAWMFDHRDDSAAEVDAIVGAAAYVMGRNMFTPGHGEWDPDWRGWWGDDPPYHGPVFVLTHHPRDPVPMEGGTTFHFVTDGLESALAQARAAAGTGDVSIAGGATTINACLAIGAVDELRLHVVPYVAGLPSGSRIFDGVPAHGLVAAGARQTPHVTHLTFRRA